MKILAFGLVLFHGLHLVPAMADVRARLRTAMGPGPYKLVFSLISAAALTAIIIGFKRAHWPESGNFLLWSPPTFLRPVVQVLMLPALILLAAAYIPSRIRTLAKHPMLAAITLWALAHLLVRGDLASILLFGSFLAFGALDKISVNSREAFGPLGRKAGTARGDIIAIAIGTMAYGMLTLVMHHGGLVSR